jgi:hypothetical protein
MFLFILDSYLFVYLFIAKALYIVFVSAIKVSKCQSPWLSETFSDIKFNRLGDRSLRN